MNLNELFDLVLPAAISICTSGIGSAIISAIAKKAIKRKIENVDEGKNLKDINRKLTNIENNIMEMRGKRITKKDLNNRGNKNA